MKKLTKKKSPVVKKAERSVAAQLKKAQSFILELVKLNDSMQDQITRLHKSIEEKDHVMSMQKIQIAEHSKTLYGMTEQLAKSRAAYSKAIEMNCPF